MDRRWFIASLVAAGAMCAGLNSGCSQNEDGTSKGPANGNADKSPSPAPTATSADARPDPYEPPQAAATPGEVAPAGGREARSPGRGTPNRNPSPTPTPQATPQAATTPEKEWDDLGDTATLEADIERRANRNGAANNNRPRRRRRPS